jgi:DNA-binding NtrC family response regulator
MTQLLALLVEDEPAALSALAKLVEREGFRVTTAPTLADARAFLRDERPQVVLTDLKLPDGSGLELVSEQPGIEIVLITGYASVETAVEALRLGAFDYLTKPVDMGHLKRVLAHIRRTHHLRGEIGLLRDELRSLGRFGRLVGASPPMQRAYELLSKIGPTDAAVLLSGESGTGKELAALTLHDLSARRDKPFLALNCGAIAPNMVESELFGHERGSFTGATQKHLGYFERAAGGTLLLDEITEMPLEAQVKLLRVLESQNLVRVGGEKDIPLDVRVLAATNRAPEAAVADGDLRQDLYYRLRVFHVRLPALRERGEDVRLLAEHFLQGLNQGSETKKSFSKAAIARLRAHAWPGNVRELKNIVQAAYILAGDEIEPECIMIGQGDEPRAATWTGAAESAGALHDGDGGSSDVPTMHVALGTSAAEVERRLVLATLAYCGGNKNRAAQMLELSLKTMYNRLKLYQSDKAAHEAS